MSPYRHVCSRRTFPRSSTLHTRGAREAHVEFLTRPEAGKFGRSLPVDFHERCLVESQWNDLHKGSKGDARRKEQAGDKDGPQGMHFPSFYGLSARTRSKRDPGNHIFAVCTVCEYFTSKSPTLVRQNRAVKTKFHTYI